MFSKYNRNPFVNARKLYLKARIDNWTFIPTPRTEIQKESEVFGRELLNELKRGEAVFWRKSTLITQGYDDVKATLTSTKEPTIHLSMRRMVMALALSTPNVCISAQDITQSYIQSTTIL